MRNKKLMCSVPSKQYYGGFRKAEILQFVGTDIAILLYDDGKLNNMSIHNIDETWYEDEDESE